MNYVFYDFETTGRSSTWDQIIQVGAILVNDTFDILDRFVFLSMSGVVLLTNSAPGSGTVPGFSEHLASKRSKISKVSLTRIAPTWIIWSQVEDLPVVSKS